MGKDNKTQNSESNEPIRELVKFSMGSTENKILSFEDDPNFKFDQFKHNEKKFGISSTYDETFYTTKLDLGKYTEEQKQRATKLEREIENKGRGGSNNMYYYNNDQDDPKPNYNEDEDEEMDNNVDQDLNQNYDDFIAGKVVFSIEDIEAKQLSMSNKASTTQPVEQENDDNNSNNLNEIYENEMIDNDEYENTYSNDSRSSNEDNKIEDGESNDDSNSNEDTEMTTNDNIDSEKEQKQGLDLKSSAFTPKVKNQLSSSKIQDEFEVSGVTNQNLKEGGNKKLKASSTSFKPSLKTGSQSFKPGGSAKPTQSVVQPQAIPYNYIPMDNQAQFQDQNQQFSQNSYGRPQLNLVQNQNWTGNSYGINHTGNHEQSHYDRFQNANGGSFQQFDNKILDFTINLDELYSFETYNDTKTHNEFLSKIDAKKEEVQIMINNKKESMHQQQALNYPNIHRQGGTNMRSGTQQQNFMNQNKAKAGNSKASYQKPMESKIKNSYQAGIYNQGYMPAQYNQFEAKKYQPQQNMLPNNISASIPPPMPKPNLPPLNPMMLQMELPKTAEITTNNTTSTASTTGTSGMNSKTLSKMSVGSRSFTKPKES